MCQCRCCSVVVARRRWAASDDTDDRNEDDECQYVEAHDGDGGADGDGNDAGSGGRVMPQSNEKGIVQLLAIFAIVMMCLKMVLLSLRRLAS